MATAKSKQYSSNTNAYQKFLNFQKQGIFPRFMVFFGDEQYLLSWSRNSLKKKLIDDTTADFNYHRMDADSFNLIEFEAAIESPPMMADYTLIELTDVNLFDSSIDQSQLASILSDIPEYCTILALYDTVPWKPDKRKKTLWKAIESIYEPFEFKEQSESELVKWIQKRFAADHVNIDVNCTRYLILRAGSSMQNLSSEIEKLKTYISTDTLTKEDIDAVVIPVLSAAIYTITEAISNRNYDEALSMLQNVLNQDIEPIRIAAAISGQIRQLYVAKILSENRKSAYDLVRLYNIYERRASSIFQQARNYHRNQLKTAVSLCAEADLKLKSFSADDNTVLVDLLVNLSRI